MSEPFIGQIMAVSFNYAPRGWAMCDGQLLGIAQNAALFSLLGTTYGGDGVTTFALPNLQGRTPIFWSDTIAIGEAAGSQAVTLNISQLPAHNHVMMAYNSGGDVPTPSGNYPAASNQDGNSIFTSQANTTLNPGTLSQVGGGQPHNNLQPYLTLLFCIALQGVFPSRN